MANVYTKLPKHLGELNLAKQLNSFSDKKLHLWYSLDHIPNVKDIDLVLWQEETGAFVIEVKAVPINSVLSFGYNSCQIKGRDPDNGPQNQALEALNSLYNYVSGILPKTDRPFFIPTACWPKIYRSEWNSRFSDERIIGEYSLRMIFADDLTGNFDSLKKRLEYIWQNPPVKKGAVYPYSHQAHRLKKFISLLDFPENGAPALVSPSELSKLRQLEERVRKQTLKDINIKEVNNLVYYGYPGTGKTFRLLEISYHYALNNKKVLLVCYNKTLAADLKRLLSASFLLKESRTEIIVKDIFEFVSNEATKLHIYIEAEVADYDKWAVEIYNEIKNDINLLKFDVILVDEAQDFKDWAFDFLSLYSTANTSFYLACGTGQELYGTESNWLNDFSTKASNKRLNRNFRNTLPVFQLAQLYYECKADKSKISSFATRFKSASIATQNDSIIFDRNSGRIPSLIRIDDSKLNYNIPPDYFFIEEQKNIFVNEYKRIISNQIEAMSEEEMPLDLLILVPEINSPETSWVISALKELNYGYTDYVTEDNRRSIANPSNIRLCTYHSARGLEGLRVIVLGFERINVLFNRSDFDYTKLGYIILSRAVFDNIIAVRSQSESENIKFVGAAISKISDIINS